MHVCRKHVSNYKKDVLIKGIKKAKQLSQRGYYGASREKYRHTRGQHLSFVCRIVKYEPEYSVAYTYRRQGNEQICRLGYKVGSSKLGCGKNTCIKGHKQKDKYL